MYRVIKQRSYEEIAIYERGTRCDGAPIGPCAELENCNDLDRHPAEKKQVNDPMTKRSQSA